MNSLDIAKEAYGAFSRGDFEKFISLCAENIHWQYFGSVPWAGTFQGREDVLRFLGQLGGAIEITAFGPDEFVVGENQVAVVGRTSARVRSSGALYENRWAHFLKIEGGKPVGFAGYDTTPLKS